VFPWGWACRVVECAPGQRQRRFHSATTSPADAQATTAEYRPRQAQKQA
jgi:hypothetical protein